MMSTLRERALETLRQQLAERLAKLTAAQVAAQSGAIHPETKQEDPKDTRAIEAGYLSRGLAERVESLRDAVATINAFQPGPSSADAPVQLGDLVALEHDGQGGRVYLLAPVGGGEKLDVEGEEILVLTGLSPIGAALIGAEAGDEVEIELPGGRRSCEIAWVR